MCIFDFYSIKAVSNSVHSLMKVGTFDRKSVSVTTDYSGRWPKKIYSVGIGFVNVNGIGHSEASKRATDIVELLPKVAGVRYKINFHAID